MKEKLIAKLNKHAFLKNILVLVSGNVLGFVINFIGMPIISRIYLPSEIGEYDLIISTGKYVMDFACLGLLVAIMLPKEDYKAKQLCQIILASNLSVLLILVFLLIFCSNYFVIFKTTIQYEIAIGLLAVYLLLHNVQNVYYSYVNRQKLYHVLFWNPVILAGSNVGISSILGILGYSVTGYFIGTIISLLLCILHMGRYVNPFFISIDFVGWKERLIEYKDMFKYQLPANLVSSWSNEIPTQFLGRIFGTTVLGGYVMAVRILSIPVSLISVPVNRVVYQNMASKINNGEDVGEFLFRLLEKNIKLALVPLGILIIFGKYIILAFLGDDWIEAGKYISILGSVYLLKFCSGCLSGTFVALGRQKLSLIMSGVNLLKFGICFGTAYMMNLDIYMTIVLYCIVEFIYQLLNIYLCFYCTEYSMDKVNMFFLKYIIGGNVVIYATYYIVNYYEYC